MKFLLPVAWDHVITLKKIKLPRINNLKEYFLLFE